MLSRSLLVLPLLLGAGCVLTPKAYWVPESVTVERVDYAGWDGLLRDHVRDGRVDYAAISRDPRFDDFVDTLRRGRFTKETTRDERLAFLINGYNALAIEGILSGQSPATLLGRREFFWRTRYPIAGQEMTLSDLENRRIRPYEEPRIHFALVCASRSCPDLRAEAYVPERLDAQLLDATRRFVNDPSRNTYDAAARRAKISAIFDWYEEDFAAAHRSIPTYLSRYVEDSEVARGLASDGWKIHFARYDWSLNHAPPRAAE